MVLRLDNLGSALLVRKLPTFRHLRKAYSSGRRRHWHVCTATTTLITSRRSCRVTLTAPNKRNIAKHNEVSTRTLSSSSTRKRMAQFVGGVASGLICLRKTSCCSQSQREKGTEPCGGIPYSSAGLPTSTSFLDTRCDGMMAAPLDYERRGYRVHVSPRPILSRARSLALKPVGLEHTAEAARCTRTVKQRTGWYCEPGGTQCKRCKLDISPRVSKRTFFPRDPC